MKNLIIILFCLTFAERAFSAPDQFSIFECNQLCGLTSTAESGVRFTSVSQSDALSALHDLCTNQHLYLQGEAKCTELKYDFTNNEHYQRCKTGISPIGACFVSVNGFGGNDRYYTAYQSFSAISLDDAETAAIEKCRNAVGYGGTCSIAWYTAY